MPSEGVVERCLIGSIPSEAVVEKCLALLQESLLGDMLMIRVVKWYLLGNLSQLAYCKRNPFL